MKYFLYVSLLLLAFVNKFDDEILNSWTNFFASFILRSSLIVTWTPFLLVFKPEYLILFCRKVDLISSKSDCDLSLLIEFVSTSKRRYDPPLKSKPRLIVCFGSKGKLTLEKLGRARKKPTTHIVSKNIFLELEKYIITY